MTTNDEEMLAVEAASVDACIDLALHVIKMVGRTGRCFCGFVGTPRDQQSLLSGHVPDCPVQSAAKLLDENRRLRDVHGKEQGEWS